LDNLLAKKTKKPAGSGKRNIQTLAYAKKCEHTQQNQEKQK